MIIFEMLYSVQVFVQDLGRTHFTQREMCCKFMRCSELVTAGEAMKGMSMIWTSNTFNVILAFCSKIVCLRIGGTHAI
jgi:hypothetical protein